MKNSEFPAVEMRNITKKFGEIIANENIDLKILKGEVHALLGENGAGKSTLMNILYGLLSADSGEIYLKGKKVKIKNPRDAIQNGIGMVHQHFMLVQPFTVTQNIILGKEKTGKLGVLDLKSAAREIQELSDKYGLKIDPEARIEEISVGMQQRVEILKALYRDAEILILDEPTAVLTPQEISELGKILRNLKKEGKSIILISHKLKEIKEMADRCTIIRKGKLIDVVDVKDVTEAELAAKMVGRDINFQISHKTANPGEVILQVQNLKVKDNRGIQKINGIDLKIHQGEILGLAGIDGNGQTELLEALTGIRKVISGHILMKGKDITNLSPKKIFDNKISYIPQDRQNQGLILDFTVAENMILKTHSDEPFAKNGKLNHEQIGIFSQELIEKFDIRPTDEKRKTKTLSGGNQQKVIVAREVSHDPDLLIAAQPTRGLDVGAIEYIHKGLIRHRDEGKAVLLVSLELDEILTIADRIAVIFDGRIVKILASEDVDMETLGLLMAGGRKGFSKVNNA
ncbi:MAG: ABC transporter ATP-binding protein [Candidatus Cloacimonetes bacterium]|nr:ABC transporter ATP-binding protein [Candidatus Cloacimonadota bacterium]MCF7815091.1 ABC transporter ATP-binding protein [Candidatus Cloacimonadota bacterium]MCF7869315.1 ABC transporter ATP-binding protein [Candidatus Cloacimonadota bacterium]MCF7884733.1 ABC transporter ATP-binding protein [Candidatus Cloacimonadota bacterium]